MFASLGPIRKYNLNPILNKILNLSPGPLKILKLELEFELAWPDPDARGAYRI